MRFTVAAGWREDENRLVKRRQALLESNLPRNNRLRLIETVRDRERSETVLGSRSELPPDDRSPMP